MRITAEVLADSRCTATGCRLTSFLLTYPRIIHSELMTHRAFSRNAASSRAIPVERMIRMVEEDPAHPVEWGTAQRGMQAGPPLSGGAADEALEAWLGAMRDAVAHTRRMLGLGVHKQVANRLLEPFAHMTTLVSATEWGNFFALRAHPDADPTFQALARAMLDAYTASAPQEVEPGFWHLPFSAPDDLPPDDALRVATARCARTSLMAFDGTFNVGADVLMHDRLRDAGHWSPFEHSARALPKPLRSGNFVGWDQYRKLFSNENRDHPSAPNHAA